MSNGQWATVYKIKINTVIIGGFAWYFLCLFVKINRQLAASVMCGQELYLAPADAVLMMVSTVVVAINASMLKIKE